MKYPIGIQTFEKIIDGGFAYIDKTDLVYNLAVGGKTYFSVPSTTVREKPSCIDSRKLFSRQKRTVQGTGNLQA